MGSGEMLVPDLETIVIASHLVLVASILRGFSGFGFAIGAVPLLTWHQRRSCPW